MRKVNNHTMSSFSNTDDNHVDDEAMGAMSCDTCGYVVCTCNPSPKRSWDGPEQDVAHKQPMCKPWDIWTPGEELAGHGEVATLPEYFDKLDVDTWDRIRLCRTYANYLAASLKTPSKKQRK